MMARFPIFFFSTCNTEAINLKATQGQTYRMSVKNQISWRQLLIRPETFYLSSYVFPLPLYINVNMYWHFLCKFLTYFWRISNLRTTIGLAMTFEQAQSVATSLATLCFRLLVGIQQVARASFSSLSSAQFFRSTTAVNKLFPLVSTRSRFVTLEVILCGVFEVSGRQTAVRAVAKWVHRIRESGFPPNIRDRPRVLVRPLHTCLQFSAATAKGTHQVAKSDSSRSHVEEMFCESVPRPHKCIIRG